MSDKKPPLDFGLEDLDWDAAIAEWDEKTVVPDVPNPSAHPSPPTPLHQTGSNEITAEAKAPITARPYGTGAEADADDPTIGLRAPVP